MILDETNFFNEKLPPIFKKVVSSIWTTDTSFEEGFEVISNFQILCDKESMSFIQQLLSFCFD